MKSVNNAVAVAAAKEVVVNYGMGSMGTWYRRVLFDEAPYCKVELEG